MMKILYHTVGLLFVFIILACSASGAFLYKNYVIQHDQGWDILCDPYIVQKNDWVIKLFQRRGQISEQDFPEFLRIFQRLNPHIHDVNKILPGQNILIPLKKLGKDTLPGQSSGIVTIPFVTISKLPDIIKGNSTPHTVKPGEYVSGIISSEFGRYGSKSYNEGIQLFKLINPGIVDLNRIYPGQVLHIPNAALKRKAWYASLFTESGKINKDLDISGIIASTEKLMQAPAETNPPDSSKPTSVLTGLRTPLFEAANALHAKIFTRGTYYFPRKRQKDLKLDLTRYPVMELATGQKFLFSENDDFPEADRAILRSHWPGLKIIPISFQSSFEEILDAIFRSDKRFNVKNRLTLEHQGIHIDINAKWIVRSNLLSVPVDKNPKTSCIFIVGLNDGIMPDPIKQYLADLDILVKEIGKDGNLIENSGKSIWNEKPGKSMILPGFYENQRNFIHQLVSMMKYQYAENIDISFPYAGIQVHALSNLISTPKGEQLLVDYGDLYGDAVSSIKNSGLRIIQLSSEDHWTDIVRKITTGLNLTLTERPSFKAANRSDDYNIYLNVPGFRIETPEKKRYLITRSHLHPELKKFFTAIGIEVMMIPDAAGFQPASTPVMHDLLYTGGNTG